MKEYLLRIFILFGVNVRIDEIKSSIDTDNDYINMKHIISPPVTSINPDEILIYTENIKNTMNKNANVGEFFNLIESNQNVNMVHRFRSIFATFDKMAPKNSNGIGIDYDNDKLKKMFLEIITSLYDGVMFARYHEIIEEFIDAKLIDERRKDKKNYSQELDEVFNDLGPGVIMDKPVAFNVLKCINLIRHKIMHGDFEGVTPKSVSGSYELLLPLTQHMLKEELKQRF